MIHTHIHPPTQTNSHEPSRDLLKFIYREVGREGGEGWRVYREEGREGGEGMGGEGRGGGVSE